MIDNKYILPVAIVVILTGAVIASETGVFDATDPAVEQQVVIEAAPEQDTNRDYEVGQFEFSPRAQVKSQTVSIYSEVGRDMNILGFEVQPFTSFQYTNTQRDPLKETGILELIYDQADLTSLHGSLGLRVDRTFDTVLGLTVKPSAHFRYIDEFESAKLPRPTSVRVSGFGGSATIFTQPGFEDAFIVGAGLEFSRGRHPRFALDYDGFYSGDYRIQSMTGRLLWSF